ncbi:MAG: hypothetical protein AAGD07_19090, partial [Planctomycetota bacterium]
TMRLLIASVVSAVALLLVIPRILSGAFLSRWSDTLRWGGIGTVAMTFITLVATLGLEVLHRESGVGIEGLDVSVIVLVAVILAFAAVVAAALAVMSGPRDGQRPDWLSLPDQQRGYLILGAQALAATAWLHKFLCDPELAFFGLRSVWPYVVMAIAFLSVGITTWAQRRRDRVMEAWMERTALFLPLIPVLGFWLSSAYAVTTKGAEWSWTFFGGTASYQGLLVVATLYYGIVSAIRGRLLPRVAAIVLANIALWVTLTQMPGWDFLRHPQAWLIPPAVCVLAILHWYRRELDPAWAKSARYGATLTIYVASTADMLLADLGRNLWGPIILVSLALCGVLLGVAMRIKPFLYLGTAFVFLGVVSMVYHAGQAIDAVWPWWVFGISSGLLILVALAGIEKNKPALQGLLARLAKWEA